MLWRYGVDGDGHVLAGRGDEVIDLARADGLEVGREVFVTGSLNRFMALGADAWEATRRLLVSGRPQPGRARRDPDGLHLVLPWEVGDYADFYASRQHVEAMGALLRPGEDPLPPAWLHIPIGYHGRAGTVVASGEPVYRPWGVIAGPDGPAYRPSGRLDVEIELGFIVGEGVARGRSVTAEEAGRHIFGMVVLNDWSARDIQAFEYRPLGPFLGKSFATSVSPWVVPMSELSAHRVAGPGQDPAPARYLQVSEPRNLGVTLRLIVNDRCISEVSAADLYWSPEQQLAHLTANGAGVRVGDLFATGTISGPGTAMGGSLMECFSAARWLADSDVATIEASAGGDLIGRVTGKVVGR